MIAREGIPFTLIGLVLVVVLFLLAARTSNWWLFGLTAVLALLTLFSTFFFRDPERHFDDDHPGVLIAPADGKVVKIDTVDNEFVGQGAIRLAIFLSVLDVHINRVPVTGTVAFSRYQPGKFLAAYNEHAADDNQRTEIGIRSDYGPSVEVRQITGLIARRIVCHLEEGDRATAGDRFGMIRFGSRTELIVPPGSDIRVSVGDRVAGGESIMGYLKSESGEADVDQ